MNEAPITKANINLLIHKARNGEKGVFEDIYDLYYIPVLNYLKRRTKNNEDALDLTQSVFLKIWKNIDTFKESMSTKSFFFTVARNTLIDYYRKRSNHEIVSDEVVFENSLDIIYEEEENALNEDDNMRKKKQILEYMKSLSKTEQDIIDMYYNQDLSYKEISVITNKKEEAIRQAHSRALKKLKSLFI